MAVLVTVSRCSRPLVNARSGAWYSLMPLAAPQVFLVVTLPTRPAVFSSPCATPIAYGPMPAAVSTSGEPAGLPAGPCRALLPPPLFFGGFAVDVPSVGGVLGPAEAPGS